MNWSHSYSKLISSIEIQIYNGSQTWSSSAVAKYMLIKGHKMDFDSCKTARSKEKCLTLKSEGENLSSESLHTRIGLIVIIANVYRSEKYKSDADMRAKECSFNLYKPGVPCLGHRQQCRLRSDATERVV